MANLDTECIRNMQIKAIQIRREIIRIITNAKEGHAPSSLSIVEIVTVLYFHLLKQDPRNSKMPERDRFILSKGHGCAAVYVALALRGFFPMKELDTFNKHRSRLPGHPMKELPGIELSTGSLGHGLSVGVGMGIAAKRERKGHRVVVLMGDGEQQEGSIWEAAMAAAHYKLDNIIGIVDRNLLEVDGLTEKVMAIEPLNEKWRMFGWAVNEVDGHSIPKLLDTFQGVPFERDKPSLIIAHTIKGKGVDYMEGKVEWHHKAPSLEQASEAFRQFDQQLENINHKK